MARPAALEGRGGPWGGLPVLGMGTAANSPEIPGVGMGKELGGAELSLSLQAAGELCPQQRGEMLLLGDPSGVARPLLRAHHGVCVKLGSLDCEEGLGTDTTPRGQELPGTGQGTAGAQLAGAAGTCEKLPVVEAFPLRAWGCGTDPTGPEIVREKGKQAGLGAFICVTS